MRQQAFSITEADGAILLALSRFHYLTAAHVSRLLYPNLSDENRYAQRRLKRLADEDYVLRLRALPMPRYGQAPHVFTLAQRGRQYLSALGVPIRPYFRPSEEKKAAENNPFMTHTLAAIDVLIAAECLCRDRSVTCPRMLTERDLKHRLLRVNLPPGPNATENTTRRIAVIPDGWFQLSVAGEPPVSIALELDRSREDQKAWRQKVTALALWADGPYRKAFDTDNVTIAVVCRDETRRDLLARWTMQELQSRRLDGFAELFLFTAASPVDLSPQEFFYTDLWYLPNQTQPISLLDPPTAGERRVSQSVV